MTKARKQVMDAEMRRQKRQARKDRKKKSQRTLIDSNNVNSAGVNNNDVGSGGGTSSSDLRIADLLTRNEDDLLNFVAKVNKVYQEKLKRPAPFMTFVICGMQSAGKSTIMERFMGAVLNIIQEGTGTRCPLDTTCIHDESAIEPKCELSGEELDSERAGEDLTIQDTFVAITEHNKNLAGEDRFSTKPLHLIYRSKYVQNMRFVDTPGIISNKGQGKDNREDIKMILRSAMKKPNTKLCVLLEPKEFSTNPIVEFCDTTFGTREKWTEDAICLMTKFDKQLGDSRSGSKANSFLEEFLENKINPFLVITPTLDKENLPHEELMKNRQLLLKNSNSHEEELFTSWLERHDKFLQQDPTDELLNEKTRSQIGFPLAKKCMRAIMLEDTARRLPEVLLSLRNELAVCEKELSVLREKEKFNNPAELKLVVGRVLWSIQQRIGDYLDGDLESSMKFPEKLMTLDDEVDEEDESEWSKRELNHYTEKEDDWRNRIENLDGNYPAEIQAESKFLGGKQVQRAIEFFRAIMIDALPNPFELEEYVANGTGFLAGGLQRENWERAMVQITRHCMKEISHPGINYLIKHVGHIFRRLFNIALEDIKQGDEFSASFKLMPLSVEKHLIDVFDVMLWDLMKAAGDKTHCALEPMYSTVDPNLPTFHTQEIENEHEHREDLFVKQSDGNFVQLPNRRKEREEDLFSRYKEKLKAFVNLSSDRAKSILREENTEKSKCKKNFLPGDRTSMITKDESNKILHRAFQYIVALMEFNLHILKFQLNHYLYFGFKKGMSQSFSTKVLDEAPWDKLTETDPQVAKRIQELEGQIGGIKDSLQEVQRILNKM